MWGCQPYKAQWRSMTVRLVVLEMALKIVGRQEVFLIHVTLFFQTNYEDGMMVLRTGIRAHHDIF